MKGIRAGIPRVPLPRAFERIPVRWRIAITTAGLTLAILVLFALVLGKMVGDRVKADFEDELRNAAGALATETRVGVEPVNGEPVIYSPKLDDFAMADDADHQRRRRRAATPSPRPRTAAPAWARPRPTSPTAAT